MKQCPFCKAKIEENARFCLYCMTSLEEKQKQETPADANKRWKHILFAVLVLVALLVCVVFLPKINAPSPSITPTNQTQSTKSNPSSSEIVSNVQSKEAPNNSSGSGTSSNIPLDSSSFYEDVSSAEEPNGSSTVSSTLSFVSTPSSQPIVSQPLSTNATYSYRDAKYGDDFAVSTDMANRIVITEIKTPSSNGEYVIPETIDGKQVLAVMSLAFCDTNVNQTVKKVIVPATVKTIWANAFANCYNLTDVYLQGSSIYIDPHAFADATKRNGKLTIHCSSTCSDRNFRYYKNTAPNYGAVYKEWNG